MNALLRIRRNSFHLAWPSLLIPPLLIFAVSVHREPVIAGLLLLLQFAPLLGLIVFLAGWFRSGDSPYFHRMANEVRTQVPGALIAIGIPGLLFPFQEREVNTWAFVFYVVGCAVMGATAFGAEFEQKTIGGLLAQPFRRSSIYREKVLVLGCLLGLALMETFCGLIATYPQGDPLDINLLIAAPVLAWCTGPLLSLLTRGTLTGTVLSVATPMLLVASGHIVLPLFRILSRSTEETLDVADRMGAWSLAVVPLYAAIGGWCGWRTFLRLEVRDSMTAGTEFNPFAGMIDRVLQVLLPKSPARSGSAMLWRKEFRVHIVPWMIAALMVGIWIILLIGRSVSESVRFGTSISYEDGFVFLASLLGGVTLLLAGAASISEERQMGVLDWQLTTPAAVSRQWWIKVAVTYIVAITLGAILPGMLLAIALGYDWFANMLSAEGLQTLTCINIGLLIVGIAIYGSSLSRNTVKAVSATIVIALIGIGTVALMTAITGDVLRYRYAELREVHGGAQLFAAGPLFPVSSESFMKWSAALLALPVLFVWLAAAGRNFRFGPPGKAAARQLGVLTLITLAILAVFVFSALLYVEWAARAPASASTQ